MKTLNFSSVVCVLIIIHPNKLIRYFADSDLFHPQFRCFTWFVIWGKLSYFASFLSSGFSWICHLVYSQSYQNSSEQELEAFRFQKPSDFGNKGKAFVSLKLYWMTWRQEKPHYITCSTDTLTCIPFLYLSVEIVNSRLFVSSKHAKILHASSTQCPGIWIRFSWEFVSVKTTKKKKGTSCR